MKGRGTGSSYIVTSGCNRHSFHPQALFLARMHHCSGLSREAHGPRCSGTTVKIPGCRFWHHEEQPRVGMSLPKEWLRPTRLLCRGFRDDEASSYISSSASCIACRKRKQTYRLCRWLSDRLSNEMRGARTSVVVASHSRRLDCSTIGISALHTVARVTVSTGKESVLRNNNDSPAFHRLHYFSGRRHFASWQCLLVPPALCAQCKPAVS